MEILCDSKGHRPDSCPQIIVLDQMGTNDLGSWSVPLSWRKQCERKAGMMALEKQVLLFLNNVVGVSSFSANVHLHELPLSPREFDGCVGEGIGR